MRASVGPRKVRPHGFTLIELLLVLLIISVLAGLIIPRFVSRSESARIAAAEADLKANLPTALELYELDNGMFPSTDQGLLALIEEPKTSPTPRNWSGPYIRGSVPKDPWKNPYQYRYPSRQGKGDYDLFSLGPDGAEGGDDDIWSDESRD